MDREEIRDTAKAVEGIVKAIPVYEDLLQPAARQLGSGLEVVAKSVNLALSPLSALVWGYEQIRSFLLQEVSQRLSSVAPENIVTPDPAIACPTIEALRYSGCHEELRDMFVNLLGTAMDRSTASSAHPAFVAIIKQLVPDEARILRRFGSPLSFCVVHLHIQGTVPGHKITKIVDVHNICDLGTEANCEFPDLVQSYLDNLCRLNLTRIDTEHYPQYCDYECERLLHRRDIEDVIAREKAELLDFEMTSTNGAISLTSFGTWFKKAVIDDKENSEED